MELLTGTNYTIGTKSKEHNLLPGKFLHEFLNNYSFDAFFLDSHAISSRITHYKLVS